MFLASVIIYSVVNQIKTKQLNWNGESTSSSDVTISCQAIEPSTAATDVADLK